MKRFDKLTFMQLPCIPRRRRQGEVLQQAVVSNYTSKKTSGRKRWGRFRPEDIPSQSCKLGYVLPFHADNCFQHGICCGNHLAVSLETALGSNHLHKFPRKVHVGLFNIV